MASNTARLLGADLVVAVTGEAGPEPQEEDPGTVWFGVVSGGRVFSWRKVFDGDPPEIVEATTLHALRLLIDEARGAAG